MDRKKEIKREICDIMTRDLGWIDEDGTFLVPEEDWPSVAGMPGFRCETEEDRKNQEGRAIKDPDKLRALGQELLELIKKERGENEP